MRTFLILLSLIWTALGVMLILYTVKTRDSLRALVADRNPRALGSIPLIIGILLLTGAFRVPGMFGLLFVLGLLALFKGIYLVFWPAAQIRKLMVWWFDRADESMIRLWGIICLALGWTVLFSALGT
jgi:hypothetical protein